MRKILLVFLVIAFIGCEKDKFKVGEDGSFVNLTRSWVAPTFGHNMEVW